MNWLYLIENTMLLLWVLMTTWILLDLRDKVNAMESRRAEVWDSFLNESPDPFQTVISDWLSEEE
jgi:hypothetical protein